MTRNRFWQATSRAAMFGMALLNCAVAHAFTPLIPLERPSLMNAPQNTPGGNFGMPNLFDGKAKSEYASHDEGTNTVVRMKFAHASAITAMRHVDRNDGATVASSEFKFYDADGKLIETIPVAHVNKRSGDTLYIFPHPVQNAARADWRVTKLGNPGLYSVGGAELTLFTTTTPDGMPSRDTIEVEVQPFLQKDGQRPVTVIVKHPYEEETDVQVSIGAVDSKSIHVRPGENVIDWMVPEVKSATTLPAIVSFNGNEITRTGAREKPAREMTIYILPHSHTDIGYTEIQSAVEKKQMRNIEEGIAAARKTAGYPRDSRFVWNIEVGWAADLFLERMNESQKSDFFDAVKKGQVVINGMYLNELSGLCRPDELIHLYRFATIMSQKTGVPVDAAMISDVPGYTWGNVTAMNQAGIKYLSAAPNYFDRIGNILKEWENKPFYWVGPDKKSKVLVWIPFWGYAMSHIYHEMSPHLITDFYDGLEKRDYPYAIAYARWAGHGDNAVPDPDICDFIRDWNERYQWPHFIISGASGAFHAFENRYGKQLPEAAGDWTGYWEDGAASSALETAENRNTSDRLSQAATAFAMFNSADYPAKDFKQAWRDTLLYSEHTWGAWCSISGPDRKETIEQWAVKKGYADQARDSSISLLNRALGGKMADAGSIDVVNTLSWKRTDLVTLTRDQSKVGDLVMDGEGNAVPSQRLHSGELVFIAKDIPPYSSRKYSLSSGDARKPESACRAHDATLENGLVKISVNPVTGDIAQLTGKGIEGNLVDDKGGEGLNSYRYMIGDDTNHLKTNGVVTVRIGEQGPVVSSLLIDSDAPGCNHLRRELRIVAGMDYVEVTDRLDKKRLEAKSYYDENGKESVNIGFGFNVPNGEMLVDLPLAAMEPDRDQLAGACKNWVNVGRWVDIANGSHGITWVSLDAPLIEIGGVTANLLNSQTNPDVWRKKIDKSQRFYSWVMNNHWGTNYRARQEGLTEFRYFLRPHRGKTDPASATRFATGFSQPLLAAERAGGGVKPMLELSTPDVVVIGLKPSDDKEAWIIRLFGASGTAKNVSLKWGDKKPKQLYISGTGELPGEKISNRVSVPGYGLVTLRAEF